MRTFFESRAGLEPRFIEGTVSELEELFGGPPPELPKGHFVPGQSDPLLVDLHAGLRNAFRELVEYAYRTLTASRTKEGHPEAGVHWGGTGSPHSRFEEALSAVLTN